MSYFAKCDQTANSSARLVTEVISADQSFIDTQPGFWVQTSYNTSPPAEPHTPDGGVALRGNYAGIGYTYDIPNDVFYAPKPTEPGDWVLDTSTWLWVDQTPPTP